MTLSTFLDRSQRFDIVRYSWPQPALWHCPLFLTAASSVTLSAILDRSQCCDNVRYSWPQPALWHCPLFLTAASSVTLSAILDRSQCCDNVRFSWPQPVLWHCPTFLCLDTMDSLFSSNLCAGKLSLKHQSYQKAKTLKLSKKKYAMSLPRLHIIFNSSWIVCNGLSNSVRQDKKKKNNLSLPLHKIWSQWSWASIGKFNNLLQPQITFCT